MADNKPTPLSYDPDYFPILIYSRIKSPSTVHLCFTANRMKLTSRDNPDIAKLTKGLG